MATGIMGAPARMAMVRLPFLNGVHLRLVASGTLRKDHQRMPGLQGGDRLPDTFKRCPPVTSIQKNTPAGRHPPSHKRNLSQFQLGDKAQWMGNAAEDQRDIKLALVITHKQGPALVRDILSTHPLNGTSCPGHEEIGPENAPLGRNMLHAVQMALMPEDNVTHAPGQQVKLIEPKSEIIVDCVHIVGLQANV